MAFQVLTTTAASITELKRDPGYFQCRRRCPGSHTQSQRTRFYCVPPALYAQLMELLEDQELGRIADERIGEAVIEVSLDDL
jgi:antitoxin StbD